MQSVLSRFSMPSVAALMWSGRLFWHRGRVPVSRSMLLPTFGRDHDLVTEGGKGLADNLFVW